MWRGVVKMRGGAMLRGWSQGGGVEVGGGGYEGERWEPVGRGVAWLWGRGLGGGVSLTGPAPSPALDGQPGVPDLRGVRERPNQILPIPAGNGAGPGAWWAGALPSPTHLITIFPRPPTGHLQVLAGSRPRGGEGYQRPVSAPHGPMGCPTALWGAPRPPHGLMGPPTSLWAPPNLLEHPTSPPVLVGHPNVPLPLTPRLRGAPHGRPLLWGAPLMTPPPILLSPPPGW